MNNFQNLDSFKLPEGFRGRPPMIVQLWWMVDAVLFKTSPQFCFGWRRFLLRLFGAKIGKKVKIRPSVTITYPWKVSIGDYSWIGDHAVLYSLGEISIGTNTVVSQKTYLCAGNHDYSKTDFPILAQPVVIRDQVWIATDVFIGPGVEIGEGAVIGARSSVFKSIEGGFLYAGNPLTLIKKR